MKIVNITFLCLLYLSCFAGAETYYIRSDGGNSTQCTGLSNSPYSGSGIHQACAWSHPFWALDDEGAWTIQGGDTLIIHSGSYMMGLGAPNTGWCSGYWPWDCHLPPLPSGIDTAHRTRILGFEWDQGCENPPELWGTQRCWHVLSLDGTSNAEIRAVLNSRIIQGVWNPISIPQ